MEKQIIVAGDELARQQEYAARVRSLARRPQTFHIVTMGCQMNERDSETIAGMLVEMGLRPESVREKADLILYNTCCVRENAENRALGNVIWLKELKKEGLWVFGTAADGNTSLYDADLKGPAVIVIGSEGDGMGRLVREQCDFLVSIPMRGRLNSLNASAAAAVVLYEAVRQRG